MILLNEREYAEECIRNGTLGEKPFFTLTILAKYYYHYKGLKKKKITETLIDFMGRYYPRYDYNRLQWDETVEKIASNVRKYKLYEIDGVPITSKEMASIEKLPSEILKRLAFTLLCIAKLNNIKNPKNHGWVNNDAKEIFGLARISCSVSERYIYLGILKGASMLEFPKKNDNLSCRVTFINNDDPNDIALFVSDFRELGYEYLKYRGKNFIRCGECGRLIRNNKAGNKKYCSKCANYIPIQRKTVTCADCGVEFTVSAKNNKTTRCAECQSERDRERKRDWKRKLDSE